jgi:hypothetical protein
LRPSVALNDARGAVKYGTTLLTALEARLSSGATTSELPADARSARTMLLATRDGLGTGLCD